MATPIAFESSWVKKEEKKKLREARQDYLDKVKAKYEKDERRKEFAKQRGDDTWMLDSVNTRIDQEQREMEKIKSKKKKKEKKRKKVKKEKKKKKKEDHKGKAASSDSESDSEEEVWAESQPVTKIMENSGDNSITPKGPQLQRDSWMQSPLDLIPTVTRDELRKAKIAKDKEEKSAEINLLDQPGQHVRELNPYWKDGGTGLPEENPAKAGASNSGRKIGDRGISWLRKGYQRCQQQAEDQGRPLEEVAAERYGSLAKLESMLAEAERKEQSKQPDRGRTRDDRSRRFMRPRSRSRERSKSKDRKRSRSGDRKRSRSRDRKRSRSNDRRRSRSRDIYKSRRSRSRSRDSRRSRSRERKRSRSPDRSHNRSLKSARFLKPEDSDLVPRQREYRQDRDRSSSSVPAWKKKSFLKPSETEASGDKETKPAKCSSELIGFIDLYIPDTESSDSSSDSSEDDATPTPTPREVPAPILSEQQMNELGAKILRAEIMGDEELASSLKDKLSAAQKAKEERNSNPQPGPGPEQEDVVVLTRADKRGMVRPLPERQHPVEPKGGRRKAGKIQTHSEAGQRQKYFDDDDKFDLKTLVEREKTSTAEDQNAMFARLAGRSAEKTDDDFQVDDVFLKNATRKRNDSRLEERDRTLAITEHKKMTAALDKCQFCFDNVAKHLIVAIGNKVYLSLPNHRSLTEGHCLIVPMQHVSAGTALDEDVWNEIQTFRKALTQMFQSQELDCVFMESAMYLKKFPHMCLECVPLPQELGDMAPIYFKKAILDSETEWAQNKKVVDLSQKDVRRAVPKGFPYFSVDFGLQGGYAHVIEDEQKFTTYFGKEVIGGMLDAEPRLWRKPWRENFDDQRKKVLQFAEWWRPYDWTQKLDM
ncbi:CWF19-like protein 2 [Liolophura sinensis]|uniref:CWF19-like protein 2 n=1 Tax=Liolophura sinensis TaxID=3198878 RepID=UPI003158ECCE